MECAVAFRNERKARAVMSDFCSPTLNYLGALDLSSDVDLDNLLAVQGESLEQYFRVSHIFVLIWK